MNVLFITAHPFLPQMYGGLQKTTDTLCHQLMKRGHRVAVFGALMPNGWFGLLARIKLKINHLLFGLPAVHDHVMGYSIWRAWFPWLAAEQVIQRVKPDIIVVLAVQPVKMALAAKPSGIPVMILLQDVEFSQHGGEFKQLGNIAAVANSHFTAKTYRDAYGINPAVVHPLVNAEKYQTVTMRQNVTFINPHKHKGLNIALGLAKACPDIPFAFVESWPLSAEERRELDEQLAKLPNVKLLPPQKDMRQIYGTCKILLAPSLWNEGYGRVATEAQFSGIPAVASTRGGLPEAVGDGGILLDPEGPLDGWVTAIRSLWDDDATYQKFSAAALKHAQRPEIQLNHQIGLFEKALFSALKP